MPETPIQDFADAGQLLPTDLLNIQRQELGLWNNYAMPVEAVLGQQVLNITVDIQDIVTGGGIQVLAAPTTGTMNVISWGYMHYTPGAQFDGSLFAVEIDDASTSVVLGQATFNFGITKAAGPVSHLDHSFVATTSPAPGAWFLSCLTPTAADGTITLYVQYENVFI